MRLRRVFVVCCCAALAASGAAAQEPSVQGTEIQESLTLEAFLAEGYEVKGTAPTAEPGVHVVYLQDGRSAARCVVDADGATRSCRALSGDASEVVAKAELRDAVLGFFRQYQCYLPDDEAAWRLAEVYFEALGHDQGDVEDMIVTLLGARVLARRAEGVELVVGCDA